MRTNTDIRIVQRSRYVFAITKVIAKWGYRHLCHPVTDPAPEEIIRLKQDNPKAVLLYVSLHKSLWETTGIPTALLFAGLTVPYVVMGDNLVRGKFFRSLVTKAGSIIIRRPVSRAAIVSSVRDYVEIIGAHLRSGIDILVFPEATRTNIPKKGRYGDFFGATFEALLEYERQRQHMSSGADIRECFIVPCNVDYSYVREAERLIRTTDKNPQTLHILDSLKMLTHIHTVYIGFGRPIRVADHLARTRQELAAFARARCLELVRILPVNVVAAALCKEIEGGRCLRETVLTSIRDTVQALKPYAERFAGFTPDMPAEAVLELAARINPAFKPLCTHRKPLYQLYRNYIGHYLGTAAVGINS